MLFFLHATFTVFWLNIAIIAVQSGELCGPWASGLLTPGRRLVLQIRRGVSIDYSLTEVKINFRADHNCNFSLLVFKYIWTASSEFGTYRLCEQRRFRRACAPAQSRQSLRCLLIQAVSQEEPSDRKPDPWPL